MTGLVLSRPDRADTFQYLPFRFADLPGVDPFVAPVPSASCLIKLSNETLQLETLVGPAMHPQTKLHALSFGVLLPYIVLVMFFAHHYPGQAMPTWLVWLGIASIVAIVLGSLAIRREHVRSTEQKEYPQPERLKFIWPFINICLLGLSMWQGYASLAPENLRHVNPDVVFCSLILLTLPLFALGTVGISVRRWNVQKLRRPSFDRNPLNWRFDPLQSLFIAMCNGAAAGVGSLLRQATGSVAFWMKGMYLSFFFGLVIGQILVYLVYRDRVVAAH